ncbi:MAG TPA: TadE/TadG family type IV pilus assembly protein [Acidimicrobiales bacterium]|nr:TadE/TadG family type IV pilus assembly protein [Acidimicrobiales bacterium]
MRLHRHIRARRRDEGGATLVEFALVAPIAFMLILGIIAGCYLAYQNSALHDGATAGARAASIETSLVALGPTNAAWAVGSTTGMYCESGLPLPIERAVAGNAPLLKVNPAPLCATSSTATQLTQSPAIVGDVNITVTCGGTCAAPTSTAVALAFSTKGIAEPLGITYSMSANSQVPVLSP